MSVAPPDSQASSAPGDRVRSLEILVVEDSLTQAFALRLLLEKHGYKVSTEEDGAAALRHLEKARVAMVIADIDMPQMNGYEMCQAIKARAELKDIPVILLTTLSDTENILEGLNSRADYYLTKPYDAAYLLECVDALLNLTPGHRAVEGQEGLEVLLRGKRHVVTAERRQMLDLLLATYENSVHQNRVLIKTQLELNTRNQQLRDQTSRLQSSEGNLRSVLEHMADGMVVVDQRGRVRFMNHAAQHLLGVAADRLMNRPFDHSVVAGETREIAIAQAQGEAVIVEMRAFVTVWEGEMATMATIRDITQRKRDELKIREQQESLREANSKLQALAALDGLTGLKNHRAFKEALLEVHSRAVERQELVSVLLLDVDRFKAYNDSFGHPAGDEVLRNVARILEANVRGSDLVARYGGEEFVVLMPQADRSQAMAVAERIRRAIENAPWKLRDVTASIGAATRSLNSSDPSELVNESDQALYHSKQSGRNRVTHAYMLQRSRFHSK